TLADCPGGTPSDPTSCGSQPGPVRSKFFKYVANHADGVVDTAACPIGVKVTATATYASGTSELGAADSFPVQAQTPIPNCVLFCGDAVVDQSFETCDTGPTSQTPVISGCPTQGTTCQCPTCVGNTSFDSNTCRAPGTTDQCTICGDSVIQLTSNETCDGSVFSGVGFSDTTKRCTAGSTANCTTTCIPVCFNSDPPNPTPCTVA